MGDYIGIAAVSDDDAPFRRFGLLITGRQYADKAGAEIEWYKGGAADL
jgi:hypothetical protein